MVYILIPTFNRVKLLIRCLDSINNQTYAPIHTVVVNDGSTDDTGNILAKTRDLTVINGDGNLWWTGAMRLGVEKILTTAKPRDFVLLMNDDTVFDKNYVETIVNQSQKNKRAIITSICFADADKTKNLEAGVLIDWSKSRYDKPLTLPKDYKKLDTGEVDAACGRGTLVPIEVFKKIGNFSTKLPHYHADYEFTMRAKRNGFGLLIAYNCIVYATQPAGGFTPKPKYKTWSQFWREQTSLRSKSRFIDHLNLSILNCPSRLITIRLYYVIKELLYNISLIRPF